MQLGVVNGVLTKLTFRCMLLKRAYTKSEFEEVVSETEFHGIDIREDLTSLEILLTNAACRFGPGRP
jgi:hypothetical protein